MTFTCGFTAEEIREYVLDYERQPRGTKRAWLNAKGMSTDRIRRWRRAVFEGDLDRGLVPREGLRVSVPSSDRSPLAKIRAAERAEHKAEVAGLEQRVSELQRSNEALGKAIGLLHTMNAQEPELNLTTNDPATSSTPKTTSLTN